MFLISSHDSSQGLEHLLGSLQFTLVASLDTQFTQASHWTTEEEKAPVESLVQRRLERWLSFSNKEMSESHHPPHASMQQPQNAFPNKSESNYEPGTEVTHIESPGGRGCGECDV